MQSIKVRLGNIIYSTVLENAGGNDTVDFTVTWRRCASY